MRWAGHVACMGERSAYRVLVDPGVEGKIILKWIFVKWAGGCMCWIDVAQDRDRWQAFVNAVMNFRVYKIRGIS